MRNHENETKPSAGLALAIAVYCLAVTLFFIYFSFFAPEQRPPRVYVPQAPMERVASASHLPHAAETVGLISGT
ncbi:hypothetical protein [Rhizobium rhizophilum]|uniref:Uncharacterized protein n=1 Tax=Rhizobium rhizophilum TaxID=1850373 RepID=A0ABY2QRM5_9HYPH|nr:hypothetical protein [Rhizobium rhizophilum]THV12672.1 hypothetical protein E9677_18260 [Rhizobium rhizophilum]